jgi:7-carboxy-7-deazaguanine synthase
VSATTLADTDADADADAAVADGAATFPVVEVFGPTVQGEGPDAGRPAYFVRFGGCDFRCSWCDSPHAVDPAQVRAHAEALDARGILARIAALPAGPRLVVLTGGNPALLTLDDLVDALHHAGMQVAVETQGTVWRDWLGRVDRLVVSPKPPSAGVNSPRTGWWSLFMTHAADAPAPVALKVVVFDDADLDFADALGAAQPGHELFLSAGTDLGLDEATTVARLRERYAWLCEQAARRPSLADARVLPQLHVVAWGTRVGV